jgi:hypothetical protein
VTQALSRRRSIRRRVVGCNPFLVGLLTQVGIECSRGIAPSFLAPQCLCRVGGHCLGEIVGGDVERGDGESDAMGSDGDSGSEDGMDQEGTAGRSSVQTAPASPRCTSLSCSLSA